MQYCKAPYTSDFDGISRKRLSATKMVYNVPLNPFTSKRELRVRASELQEAWLRSVRETLLLLFFVIHMQRLKI